VDALADRALPNRVVRRRWTQVKEKVMGTPQATGTMVQDRARSVAGAVGDTASKAGHKAEQIGGDIADAVREAPQMVAERTQGNPIAVGLIAFGAGLLVASLVPTTEFEKDMGQQLKESAEPLRQPLMESGQRLKEDVSESVGQAAEEVKQTAKDSAQKVADDTKSAAQQMTNRS